MGARALLAAAAALAAAHGAAGSPQGLTASKRVLDYLHSRGEALHITTPAPIKATYCDWEVRCRQGGLASTSSDVVTRRAARPRTRTLSPGR